MKPEPITSTDVAKLSADLLRTCSAPSEGQLVTSPNPNSNMVSTISMWPRVELESQEKMNHIRFDSLTLSGDPDLDVTNNSLASAYPCQSFCTVKFEPTGRRFYGHRIKESKKNEASEVDLIEEWDSKFGCLRVFNVTEKKVHGEVVTSPGPMAGCGGMDFSPHEFELAYVAEKKLGEKVSHFDKTKETATVNKFAHVDSWGEQLSKYSSCVIAILKLIPGDVTVLDFLPEEYSYSDPVWVSNDQLAVIGYKTRPYRLGLVYCRNREADLFLVDVRKNEFRKLTDKISNAYLAMTTVTPDKSKIVCVTNDALGPHNQAKSLIAFDWAKQTEEIVASGLFIESFPRDPWLSQDELVVNVSKSPIECALILNIKSKKVRSLNFEELEGYSYSILHVSKKRLLMQFSSFLESPGLAIAYKVPEKDNYIVTKLHEGRTFASCKVEEISHEEEGWNVQVIGPNNQASPRPGILYVHGGPHVWFSNSFDIQVALFLQLGFNVVTVNYRGSCGFSDESLNELPGKIGSLDVQDCYDGLQEALQLPGWKFDLEKLAVTGGSHGGFLSLHLIGQYPSLFKACIVRNPVTNLGSMIATSDIPDWVTFETYGENYKFDSYANPELYAKAFAMSPMRYIEKVTTPVQLHLGLKDLRVPPSQGKEYYRALLGQGKAKAQLFEYPEDNHPIASPEGRGNFLVECALWLATNLNLNSDHLSDRDD